MASHAKSSGKQKKILKKNSSKDPLGHQIWFYTKERGAGLPCVGFKNRSTSRGNEDQSKPSPRFACNGIHTKSGADNLQGNSFGKGLVASQVSIKRES